MTKCSIFNIGKQVISFMSKKTNKTLIAIVLGTLATGIAFLLRGLSMREEKPVSKKATTKKKAKK